jgi:hypothetical protein
MKPMDHMPKGSLRSPYTMAAVDHLRTHGPCTLEQLHTVIQQVGNWVTETRATKTDSLTRALRLLHKLREGAHVHRVLRDDVMLWAHGPQPKTAEPITEPETEAEPDVLAVVQAPRFDLMRAPLYVPDAGPALRPGALNFKACASRGQRC